MSEEQGFSPALILRNSGLYLLIMYLAELRLTLALLGYEVGRKRCALTKEELLHLLSR